MSKRQKLAAGLLFAAYLVVYSPLVDASFIWDDDDHFVADPLQMKEGGLYEIWFSPNRGVWNYWPVARTSFWLERQIWGVSAAAAHAVNWLLHGLSAFFLFHVLRRLRFPCALLAVGLVLLHPVFVESVSWVTERKNVLSMAFAMASTLTFVQFLDTKRLRDSALTILLVALALLSKSSVVALPLVFVGLVVLRKSSFDKPLLACLVPCFLLTALVSLGSLYFERTYIGSGGELFELDIWQRFTVFGKILLFYPQTFLNPTMVNFIYPRWDVTEISALDLLPWALIVTAVTALMAFRRKQIVKAVMWGLGAYVVILIPVSGLFNIYGMRFSYVSDHWFYPGAIPISVLVAYLIDSLLKKMGPSIQRAVPVVLLVALASLSWLHAGDFKDPKTLWLSTIEGNPTAELAHIGLCEIYIGEGNLAAAQKHCELAARGTDQHPEAYVNLGLIESERGNMQQAAAYARQALQVRPDFAKAYLLLGEAAYSTGEYQTAFEMFNQALEIAPGSEEVYLVRGGFLTVVGQDALAVENYTAGLQKIPHSETMKAELAKVRQKVQR